MLPTDSELLLYTMAVEMTLEAKPDEREAFMSAVDKHMSRPTAPLNESSGGGSTVCVAPKALTMPKSLVGRVMANALGGQKEDVLTSIASAMAAYGGPGRVDASVDAATIKKYFGEYKQRYHGPRYTSKKMEGQPRATAALHLIVSKMRAEGQYTPTFNG